MLYRIVVIGCGTVGSSVIGQLSQWWAYRLVAGYEIDPERAAVVQSRVAAEVLTGDLPQAMTYLICVYKSEDILKALDMIAAAGNESEPFAIIESCPAPADFWDFDKTHGYGFDIGICPERMNPPDPEHQDFNMNRVISGTSPRARKRTYDFYREYMPAELLHMTDWNTAVLSHAVDNSVRYVDIAVAEELAMICEDVGVDFDELRRVCNTKWNINIMEARGGIGGRCLPKDMDMLLDWKPLPVMSKARRVDRAYRKWRHIRGLPVEAEG